MTNGKSKLFFMKNILAIFSILVFIFCFSCGKSGNTNENKSSSDSTVALEKVKTVLPDSAGAEIFKASCIVCHSLRYIQMQPNFPQKTWEKTVDKMRKMYGAPLNDSTAKIIVNYLMKIKGKK